MDGETFDEVYRRSDGLLYGDAPAPDLVQLIEMTRLAPPGRVLDLGCGDGRHALYLAGLGFDVDGVDTAPTAIERLTRTARGRGVHVAARVADVRAIDYPADRYLLIVGNTILDHLERDDGDRLVPRIKRAVQPGGYVFISTFTTDDPGCTGIGPRSETAVFVKRYFAPGELRWLFRDFQILDYHEERILDAAHGTPHRHAIARLSARRPEEPGSRR